MRKHHYLFCFNLLLVCYFLSSSISKENDLGYFLLIETFIFYRAIYVSLDKITIYNTVFPPHKADSFVTNKYKYDILLKDILCWKPKEKKWVKLIDVYCEDSILSETSILSFIIIIELIFFLICCKFLY